MGEFDENATGRGSSPEVRLLAILEGADPGVRDAFMRAVATSAQGSRRCAGEVPAVVVQLVVERASVCGEA